MTEQTKSIRLTGLWEKNGKNGAFATGKLTKAELITKLEGVGDTVEFVVSANTFAEGKENAPNSVLMIRNPYVGTKGAGAGTAPAASAPRAPTTGGARGAAGRRY